MTSILSMESRTILKAVLVVGLGIGCIFQVKESVEKFVAKRKASVSETRSQPSTIFPTLTICNKYPFKEDTIYENIYHGAYKTDQEIEEAWNNCTFSFSDLFAYATFYLNGVRHNCNSTESCGKIGLQVSGFATMYRGMCYSFRFTSNATSKDFLSLIMNQNISDTGVDISPMGIVHPEGHQISVSTLTWRGSPYEFDFVKNAEIDLNITPQEFRKSDSDQSCDNRLTEVEYFHCFKSHLAKSLFSKELSDSYCNPENGELFGNCTSANTMSSASNGNHKVDYCKTKENNACTKALIYKIGQSLVDDSANPCKKPCITQNFVISRATVAIHKHSTFYGKQIVMMYLSKTQVEVFDEYLLFDSNSIVSSVGGSMGLFLSFSFLECFLSIFDYVKKCSPKL